MELSGSRIIAADRETVWEKLNDAETLKACIPGCEELTGNADDGFEAVVKQKVGPVKATFKGTVRIEDANPPSSYRLVGEGKGGVAGFAKGGADVTLADEGDETLLSYEVRATVGGKLARLGSRLIDSTAKKVANQFFENFHNHVSAKEPGTQQ